jgi:molybdenum cofactor synthesis domain-containing protein
MCDSIGEKSGKGMRAIPVRQAVGTVLAHDITEIRKDDFKGPAFRKGHIVRQEDICHLQRLGKEHLYVLQIADDELHEDDAARAVAAALMGEGVTVKGDPREGKVTIVAARDGLLKVDAAMLREFNLLGDVMCATLHTNTVVRKGQEVAGTRAIPLVVKRSVIDEAVRIAQKGQGSAPPHPPLAKGGASGGVVEVKELRKPRAGVVITGNEVYHGRIKDAFAPIIAKKIEDYGGEVVGTYYAPDDEQFIESRLRELLNAGADLLITTGGMSVDPDDVTRFAISQLGARDITYGSAVLPGAMVLVGYVDNEGHGDTGTRGQGDEESSSKGRAEASPRLRVSPSPIPIMGIPACGMYHRTTVFDLILPRVLAGERIGRPELAELGHGGLCLHCTECRWPVCPFGK